MPSMAWRGATVALFLIAGCSVYTPGFCDQTEEPTPATAPAEPSAFARFFRALGNEAKRYGRDSVALVRAPLGWDSGDWRRAAGTGLVLVGLLLVDREIDRKTQQQRSLTTDRVSAATTALGGGVGRDLAALVLVSGLAVGDSDLRDTGRDALEAAFLTRVLVKYVLKPGFGRERPEDSGGRAVFRPGSGNDSFPSGHATQAFAIASVVASRSKGWVIPTIAYAAAGAVAFDRVNDRAHFASDVAAGALLGTAVGRFLVERHRSERGGLPVVSIDVVPMARGVAVVMRF